MFGLAAHLPLLWSAAVLAIKVLALFGFLVLIRLSTPRPRLESMSRSGWLTGLALLAYVFVLYAVVFVLW